VKKLKDRPFALVGVNTNGYDPKKLKDVMDKEKLTWRSFADPLGKEGVPRPICSKWNLEGTPTLYLIDHRGVIRRKWLGSPGEKEIDRALDKLLKEAQGEAGK
jgi:peroxiredoxin